ncbi:hypothetical protein [Nocardia sp. SC052]|uniref:hypothetical protein n=1 Tax=Nocardia sichangensis TaxID=3385975 RepID=UPI0039A2C27D
MTEDKYQSIDWGPMTFMFKITKVRQNFTANTIDVRSTPLEDTIRPVSLTFPPPLQRFGTNPAAFIYHWERLTYTFKLPNPEEFDALPFDELEKRVVARFVTTCQNLAGYTVINDSTGGMNITSKDGEWTLVAELPTHQEFTGISATFRQIHNDKENASFIAARRAIKNAILRLETEATRQKARTTIKAWSKAREALSGKMIETLICDRLMSGAPDSTPRSLQGIDPDYIIQTYNYGETLHWGNRREALEKLEDDPTKEKFHKVCCLHSMTQLSHLYFGFAELCASALGYAKVTSVSALGGKQ